MGRLYRTITLTVYTKSLTVIKSCERCGHLFPYVYTASATHPFVRVPGASRLQKNPNQDPEEGVLCPNCNRFLASAEKKYFPDGLRSRLRQLHTVWAQKLSRAAGVSVYFLLFSVYAFLFIRGIVAADLGNRLYPFLAVATAVAMPFFGFHIAIHLARASDPERPDRRQLSAYVLSLAALTIVAYSIHAAATSARPDSRPDWTALILIACLVIPGLACFLVDFICKKAALFFCRRPASALILTLVISAAAGTWLGWRTPQSIWACWALVPLVLFAVPLASACVAMLAVRKDVLTLQQSIDAFSDVQLNHAFRLAYTKVDFKTRPAFAAVRGVLLSRNQLTYSAPHSLGAGIIMLALGLLAALGILEAKGRLPGKAQGGTMVRELVETLRSTLVPDVKAQPELPSRNSLGERPAVDHQDQLPAGT
jgi:hypothetical protein